MESPLSCLPKIHSWLNGNDAKEDVHSSYIPIWDNMIVSPFHPLFGITIGILILCGTILFGQKLLTKLGQQESVVVALGLGMVLISQSLYIFTLNKVSINIGHL